MTRRSIIAPSRVKPGGHFMHREHPELFNRGLLEALDRYRSA